jgi:hypothetical protein
LNENNWVLVFSCEILAFGWAKTKVKAKVKDKAKAKAKVKAKVKA